METPLEPGIAKIEITPLRPSALTGFASRTGQWEAVDHPLYLRVFYFRQKSARGRSSLGAC